MRDSFMLDTLTNIQTIDLDTTVQQTGAKSLWSLAYLADFSKQLMRADEQTRAQQKGKDVCSLQNTSTDKDDFQTSITSVTSFSFLLWYCSLFF